MTRKEFAKFINMLREADERGENLDAIVKKHENENVYVYNDACFKKIFASEKNIALTADLVNAALNLHGTDRIENLNLLAFQFFNAFPWKKSRKYRHTVQLCNQDMQLYFDKQAITVVEVQKFYHHAEAFAGDHSRLAQWLRAIDTLNREADFSDFASDPIFRVLQNEVKLCNFSSRYLMTEGMNMVDMALERWDAVEKVARNLLRDGDSAERVARNTGIPLYMVLDLKRKMRKRRATH